MPELPEVETVKRGLVPLIVGKRVLSVDFDWPKSFPNAPKDVEQFLLGAQITGVVRRAKVLMIHLATGYSLVVHLKMTGQLVYRSNNNKARFGAGHPNDSLVGELPDKSTRVILELEGAKLFFNDQRKFGYMKLVPTTEIPHIDFFKRVGPEPLDDAFSSLDFKRRVQRRANTSIKAALLDQSVLAGIGNIYADESLWGARIHPATLVRDVSAVKLTRLLQEIKQVLTFAIEQGGSTDRNYVNHDGKRGSYLNFARVFRKENEPCPRCGTIIQKIRVAGRGTHFCPKCQVYKRKKM